MDHGRVAFLDFGMTKHLDKDQISLEIAALEAIFDDDPEELRVALHDLGFNDPRGRRGIAHGARPDRGRLVHGGPRGQDRPQRVMEAIAAVSDPRSSFYRLMRRENIPANELMGRRMGRVSSPCWGAVEASRNWYRIGREWWFAEPSTELGELEWHYFESRGERHARRFAARRTPISSSACAT